MQIKGERNRKNLVVGIAVFLLLMGGLAAGDVLIPTPAEAAELTREERRALRAQERAERKAEREQRREERRRERDQKDAQEQDEQAEPQCECKMSTKLGDVDVRWNGRQLLFVPQFDVRIRVNGEEGAPHWNATLAYDGNSQFTEGTMSLPASQAFSGEHSWGGQCFDGRFDYSGVQGEPVSLASLSRSLFREDDELMGRIVMKTDVSGCEADNEQEYAEFEIGEFGALDLSRWRGMR